MYGCCISAQLVEPRVPEVVQGRGGESRERGIRGSAGELRERGILLCSVIFLLILVQLKQKFSAILPPPPEKGWQGQPWLNSSILVDENHNTVEHNRPRACGKAHAGTPSACRKGIPKFYCIRTTNLSFYFSILHKFKLICMSFFHWQPPPSSSGTLDVTPWKFSILKGLDWIIAIGKKI